MLLEQQITEAIIGAAIEVHRELGPGLLESAIEECFCHELHLRDLRFQWQVELPVDYKGIKLDCGYRLDVVVENAVIVELKSIDQISPIHHAQLLTYLRLARKKSRLADQFQRSGTQEWDRAQGAVSLDFSVSPCLRGEMIYELIPNHSERRQLWRSHSASCGPHAAADAG